MTSKRSEIRNRGYLTGQVQENEKRTMEASCERRVYMCRRKGVCWRDEKKKERSRAESGCGERRQGREGGGRGLLLEDWELVHAVLEVM